MRSFRFLLILLTLWFGPQWGQAAQDSLLATGNYAFYFNRSVIGEPEWHDSLHNLVELKGLFQANSASLPFLLPLHLLFKQDISNPLKKRTETFPGRHIRFEDELSASVKYSHRFSSSGFWIQVRYGYRTCRNLFADNDVYGLVFFGNARYEDKSISLNNLTFSNFSYVKTGIGFGQRKQTGKELTIGYGIHLDVLQGINVQQAKNRGGSLYTAPDGEYIEARYDLTLNIGREGAVRYTDWNGVGGSLDAFIYAEKKNHRISLSVQDLGYLYFKPKAVNYTGSNTVRFQGIVISDLLNIGNQRFDSLNTDSLLKSYLPGQSREAFGTITPTRVDLTYSLHIPKKNMTFTAGLRWKNLTGYYAYGFIQSDFFLRKNWAVSIHAGSGSYDLFNLGLQVTKFWKSFFITLGSDNLAGTILPMYYPGGGLMIRSGVRF